MLSNTLVTNEIKDSTGAEIEFQRRSTGPGATTEFAKIGEGPAVPYRLKISHQETGTGIYQRRRSVIRFDKDFAGIKDSQIVSAYIVLDAPIGDQVTTAESKNVLANLMSFVATDGTGTTVLFDGTGNGAQVLLNGTI